MLADLFKPAWKSHSVEKRLKAIASMDSEAIEQQKILTQMANDDQDVTVCVAAIHKINSAPVLHEMSLKHGNDKKTETVCNAASNRLNELMGESAALNPQQFDDLLKNHPELNVRIAAHAESLDVRKQALQGLSSSQLLEVLSETIYTDSRQQIAGMLLDVESLESARKIMRGKDKNAERIVKIKLDEFKVLERKHAAILVTVNELIEEVEYLSSHDGLPEFMARCRTHCNSWDTLDVEIDKELKQRYHLSREILDTQCQAIITVDETQKSQQKLLNELQALLQNVADRDLKHSIDQFFETHEKRDELISNWQSLAAISSPDKTLNDQYHKMVTALKSAIQLVEQIAPLFPQENDSLQTKSPQGSVDEVNVDEVNSSDVHSDELESVELKSGELKSDEESTDQKSTDEKITEVSVTVSKTKKQPEQAAKALYGALKKLNWPSTYGVLQLETELQEQLAEWNTAKQDAAESHERKLALVHKNISSIFHFAKIGNLTRAKQMCVRVEKVLGKFSGKDATALKARYEEANQNLGDMGDWKSFATEPKYVELCEEMEQMIGSKKHSDKLFKDMKTLQQQWKELGNSDISDKYWPRFKEASDKVYEPIAVFFEERRVLRKTNLELRQQQVEQMRELLEQSGKDSNSSNGTNTNPDYKLIESTLRSITSRFTAIKDVEHKPGQKQWEQFSKIKDEVYAKLGLEYDANIELKQTLIKQAEALAAAPVKDENLATLKTLQHRWKQIGVTRRKDDQKAWTEFKKQGDQVFNQIQEVRQGQRDENDQQLNAYRDIIKSIQSLAKTATELSEADHQFIALQASYDELPELPQQLPEKLIEGVQRDYRNACSQFDECHDRIINNMRKGQLDALRLKAGLCTQLEALFNESQGGSPDEKQLEQIAQIEKQWNSIKLEDSELSNRIEERRKTSQIMLDRADITAERRLMCIKLEIAKGTETPAEDKAERMQFQLDQMNESGLGQQTLNNAQQLKNMELDWLCLSGAEPKQQAILDDRFWRAFDSK